MNESASETGAADAPKQDEARRSSVGAGAVYAATTSEGVLAPVKVVRKIKPPSATFLQGGKGAAETDGSRNAEATVMTDPPAQIGEDLFASPAEEISAISDSPLEEAKAPEPEELELSGPAPVAAGSEELSGPSPVANAPVDSAPAATESGALQLAQQSYSQERLMAELRELDDIVSGLESLKFLKPRLARSLEEGADAMTLVSFYRLAARSLKDESAQARGTSDQLRREFETMRSKANKLELELATSQANPGAGGGAPSGGGGGGGNDSARVAELEGELQQVNAQREKLLFDFKNMRDRAQREIDLKLFKDKEKFFTQFLPVLDSFERAKQQMNESSGVQTLLDGFRLIDGMVNDVLKEAGLELVDTDCPFDPRFHEAIGEVETQEKYDDYCYDVLSTGYKLGERLIRPAMIRVARNRSGKIVPKEAPSEEAGTEIPPASEE